MHPPCDCAGRAPTYPDCREHPHLPGCVWEQVRRLQEAVAALATARDMGDETAESAESQVERILYPEHERALRER